MASEPVGIGLSKEARLFAYVGPAAIADAARAQEPGAEIRTRDDLAAWLSGRPRAEWDEPFTYTVGANGVLRLAPRRGEHVACAGGAPVRAAGEIGFMAAPDGWAVGEVSNQSTGYCPDLVSWLAVARALDLAGVPRPDAFTHPIVFRRCPVCGERNIVREDHFCCALCEADLPAAWNFD